MWKWIIKRDCSVIFIAFITTLCFLLTMPYNNLVFGQQAKNKPIYDSKNLAQIDNDLGHAEINNTNSLSAVKQKTISLKLSNVAFEKAIEEIAKKANLKFTYSRSLMPNFKKVSISSDSITVNEALWAVLEGTNLRYTISKSGHLVLPRVQNNEEVIQTGTVRGIVRDSDSEEPIIGANIYLREIERGASTDIEGMFEISDVPAGNNTIIVSYVGYNEYQDVITVVENESLELDINLESQAFDLDEVTVTAFGLEREQRSLGYTSQSIASTDISRAKETNLVNSMQGRIAGVDITNGGGSVGGSSRIVLRGARSLSGDNQPLFVVDGVYVDNSNFDAAGPSGWDDIEIDFGNAVMDINPEDIESMTVLKGANAAALYGSRAANGAIVITTKSGQKSDGLSVEVNTGFEAQDILEFPEYQNKYGHGKIDANGVPQFEWVDGRGGGTFDAVGESWGPPLDEGLMIPQWWSNGEPVPWVSNPGNTRSFFETGTKFNNSIAISRGSEDSHFRLSISRLDQKGMVPNEALTRNNVSLSGGGGTDRFKASGKISYVNLGVDNRAEQGYNWNNVMFTIGQWTARQIDMDRLRNYKDENGNMVNWNMIHENPYWIQYENTNSQVRDRFTGNASISYELTNWLNAELASGTDIYEDRREVRYAKGSNRTPNGQYSERIRYINEWTSRLMLNVNRQLTSRFSLTGLLGAETVRNELRLNSGFAPELSLPNLYTLENSAVRPIIDNFKSKKAVNSLYGSASLGYNEYVYLEVTGRNDWSSTLPIENNSYFYPSVSTSIIFSDIIDHGLNWFTYGSLRGGWTKVGNDTDPYQLELTYSSGRPFGGIPTYAISNSLPNLDLKPEQTTSWEIGSDLRFFQNRLRLDMTYYESSTVDQILPVQISRASGYDTRIINVGEIENKGIEIMVGGSPIETNNFRWDMNVNFNRNRNKVLSLTEGLDSYVIGGRGASVEARPGEPFGVLYGTAYQRNDEGKIIVDERGIPLRAENQKAFGTYAPDWSGSISNTFSFNNLSLSFLVDTKQGGVIHSDGYRWGRYAGTYIETLEGREEPFVYNGGSHANGAVKQDGTANDIPIDMKTVYPFNRHYASITESTIFDATYIKLREVSLNYSLPQSWFTNLPIRSLDISVTGRNLWIIHKEVPHIDPETALNTTNMQGIESNQIPPARRYGFNIKLSL